MIDPTKEPSLALVLAEYERRIGALETASRTPALTGGSANLFPSGTPPTASFGNLSAGGVGPTVTINVPPSGRVYVQAVAVVSVFLPGDGITDNGSGYITLALSGANTFTPAWPTDRDNGNSSGAANSRENASFDDALTTTLVHGRLLTGLTPGETTFTMKYAQAVSSGGPSVSASNRSLLVIPL